MSSEKALIIGTGHAGVAAGFALRSNGFEGDITLIGDEGHIPYHRPPLSKTYIKGGVEVEKFQLRPATLFEKNRLTLLQNTEVVGIDTQAQTVNTIAGDILEYDHLIIATGTRARPLPIPGHDLNGVYTLRTLVDANAIKAALLNAKNTLVIGGGFIGLEFAAAANEVGLNVTVLEAGPRIMSRSVSPLVSETVMQLHQDAGITVHCDTQVESITGSDRVTGVMTADGRSFDADMVIIGVGAIANDELATAAGLDCDDGILVNPQMQTSTANVYAIGDVARHENAYASGDTLRLESVQNANDQAKVAAANICGEQTTYTALPWFWSDQGRLKLQMAGLAGNADQHVIRGDIDSGSFSVLHYKGENFVAADTLNNPKEHMAMRKILAAGNHPAIDTIQVADSDLSQWA